MAFGNESSKERLKRIIEQDLAPKLETLAGPLTKECIEYITQNCRLKQVAKNQHIEESGPHEDGHLIYLCSGTAHSFYYDYEIDKTFSTRIWKKGSVMFNADSFVNNKHRIDNIQMLEDGELLSFDYYHLKALLQKFPDLYALFAYLQIERERYNQFYQHLLKQTVEERVNLFLKHYPALANRINQDAIALYLGISRSRFSTAYTQYKQNEN